MAKWDHDDLKNHANEPKTTTRYPSDIHRGIMIAQDTEPSVEGEQGTRQAFNLAQRLLDYRLDVGIVMSIMTNHWNARCSPPWSSEELLRIIKSAEQFTTKRHTFSSPSELQEKIRKDEELRIHQLTWGLTAEKKDVNSDVDPEPAQFDTMAATEEFPRLTKKDTNPKDSIGIRKPRSFQSMSGHVDREVSIGMMEGAMKYGRHNYRVAGVKGSVYYDAAREHLTSWWEGEDIDPDSGLSHITKAICSLYVLRDAMIADKFIDDRPPVTAGKDHRASMQEIVDKLFVKYPNPVPAYTSKD